MKGKNIFSVLLCLILILAFAAACNDGSETATPEPTPADGDNGANAPDTDTYAYTIDFADGNVGFVMANTGTPGTDAGTTIAASANGLAIKAPAGRNMRVGINVDGLLGERVTDVKTIVMDIYAEYPDGNFSAVSGRIGVMSGDRSAFAESKWQVYLATRNPNQAIFEFEADQGFSAQGPNLVEFSCLVNGPADKGETPAIVHIESITFYDANDMAISAKTNAGWAAPESYGEGVVLSKWEMLNPPPDGSPGGWQTWFTPGTDNYEGEDMPWEIVAVSYGIAFEIADPVDSFEFVYFGVYNSWAWTQVKVHEFWADGVLTVMWQDIDFDPGWISEAVEEGDDGVLKSSAKFAMGNWNSVPVTAIYLLYDADMVPDSFK